MRLAWALLLPALLGGQGPDADPAYAHLTQAYGRLQEARYDEAIASFEQAVAAAPERSAIRKDLAYAYLKTGERVAARDQFGEAMRLNPRDLHVALEYAFLCHETGETARARRVFDRLRQAPDADDATRTTAAEAFRNIDGPLAEGIERWSKVIEASPDDVAAHHELAQLAERRDEFERAARHYCEAWRLKPERTGLLVDLGRVLWSLNRLDEATAVLVAASRAAEARTREMARALLPERYPYVSEFRKAIDLTPENVRLRRDLAYLLLELRRQGEAEREFRGILRREPGDLLSAAQLGFILYDRGERAEAMPLLERVLAGKDGVLANRARALLRMPQQLPQRGVEPAPVSASARTMAERSLQAGYLKDALRYLETAHEADPADAWVLLQLGWVHNLLRSDRQAIGWFDQARRTGDARIAAEADAAYRKLRPALAPVRTSTWLFPIYSSRWRDFFGFGQVKTEFRLGGLPVRPYLSTRFVGDVRRTTGGPMPLALSENSVILGAGLATGYWNGLMAWGEAGWAVSFIGRRPEGGRMVPDYRGGLSYAKGFGRTMPHDSSGLFYEMTADAVFISRFQNTTLFYWQQRAGLTLPRLGATRTQLYWNGNFTGDARRLDWANFAETGPGVRWQLPFVSKPVLLSVDLLRGYYTVNQRGVRRAQFDDIRAGLWYAFSQ
ncbi:MAG: tetratricopeptide repeat protein [Bryobacterales bacterium]|nr:tetratricopeptide repeat protein [Bryobacterales bacterium]